jgi:hypothetical protein
MSWKSRAVAAIIAAGLIAAPLSRAGDLFHLARPGRGAPAQALALAGGVDTLTVGSRGVNHGAYFCAPNRKSPRYDLSVGIGLPPPPYYYAPPDYYGPAPFDFPPPVVDPVPPVTSYSTPSGVGVTTYSLPEGNVTYSVTRPPAPGAEQVPPPVPREGPFPYDGGPERPVPIPYAEPTSASSPRYFHIAPLDTTLVSLPAGKGVKGPARGKFVYPAYGEQPRHTTPGQDRTIIIKEEKKSGR